MGHPARFNQSNNFLVSVVVLVEDGKLMIRVTIPMAIDSTDATGRQLIANG
jgi:hypothetical protein